jgi:hypothetical protein
MNPTTKAAVEALENYVNTIATAGGGDKQLFMAAIRQADEKARAALALLRSEPEPTTEENSVVERERFEADAEPMGFDLTRVDNIGVEPWSDYADSDTGHRWGGWQARASLPPAPEPVAGWQPIDSAPKDAILLLGLPAVGALRDPSSRRVYEGRWNEEQQTWTSVNGFIVLTGATHWQALPSAPTKGTE